MLTVTCMENKKVGMRMVTENLRPITLMDN